MAKESKQVRGYGEASGSGIPVPSHLAGWVLPLAFENERLTATIRCPCGSERLEFHYPGQTQLVFPDWLPYPCTAEIQDGFFFIVKAVCTECRQEHTLFDKDFHGCDGFLNPGAKEKALPRPRLWPWRCLICGSAVHTGEVCVILDYKDRYFEYGEAEKFGPDRWPDAFGCIAMGIECCGCGHKTPIWVDYETR